jgi:hypothetical protein
MQRNDRNQQLSCRSEFLSDGRKRVEEAILVTADINQD